MCKIFTPLFLCLLFSLLSAQNVPQKDSVEALYLPLADHYAAIIAYERYGDEMVYAEFSLQRMKNWDLLRARFLDEQSDMAFVMAPLAVAMFQKKPIFRWIGLLHRDGNALAVNRLLAIQLEIQSERGLRKPDSSFARAVDNLFQLSGKPIEIGVPHIQSTHSVVLYRYLKEHGLSINLKNKHRGAAVTAIEVAPSLAPAFVVASANKAKAAAFEQSLPWTEIVEQNRSGSVVWYSKDVMTRENGHVECIALATDKAIASKKRAIQEVMFYIRKAGEDIETARKERGAILDTLVADIQKHIPAHEKEAIVASLDHDLHLINYKNLTIDEEGLLQIVEWAIDGEILEDSIDIKSFSDHSFDSFPDEKGGEHE